MSTAKTIAPRGAVETWEDLYVRDGYELQIHTPPKLNVKHLNALLMFKKCETTPRSRDVSGSNRVCAHQGVRKIKKMEIDQFVTN